MNRTKQKSEVSVSTKFSVEEISQILELMKQNDVQEFRLELGEGKLFLKREGEQPVAALPAAFPLNLAQPAIHSLPVTAAPAAAPAAVPTAAPAGAVPASQATTPAATTVNYHELKSPMVGTFYRRPSPDAPQYAQVGDMVRKGQTLCIVEAMKLMNEIQADVAGKIVEVLLDDGNMAEYGEVLFRIDTGV